jgi:stress response protein SCP2
MGGVGVQQELMKGQNVPLDPEISSLRMSVRWVAPEDAVAVDLVALIIGQSGSVRSDADMIFYNQPGAADGSVVHAGKVLGDGHGSDDVCVDIPSLGADVMSLTIAASTDGAPFGAISTLEWCVVLQNGETAVRYKVEGLTTERALVLGELYRRAGGWRLRAVGQGWDGGLAGLATDYGVAVETELAENPSPAGDENAGEFDVAESGTGTDPDGPAADARSVDDAIDVPEDPAASAPASTDTASTDTASSGTASTDPADLPSGPPPDVATIANATGRQPSRRAQQKVRVAPVKSATVPAMRLADDPAWTPSRLFSISGIGGADEQEKRATSALLWAMSAVRPLGRAVTARAMAPAGNVETFLEVSFPLGEQRVIPDGVIRIGRGDRVWTALVEVKTAEATLHREQLESYLRVAKRRKYDVVLTISNEVSTDPGIHPVPVAVGLTTAVALVHLSWSEVMHEIRMLLAHHPFTDPLSMWILAELLRYLEHPRSGTMAFHDMGAAWVPVRESVAAGTLRPGDRTTEPVVLAWHRLVRQLALGLTARLGVPVKQVLPRRLLSDPDLRNREAAVRLANDGVLTTTFKVPDAAGPITVTADLRTTRIRTSIVVAAPQEGPLPRRIAWLTRQLRTAPDTLLVEAHFDQRTDTTCEHLSDIRDHPGTLIPGKDWEPSALTVSQLQPMGTKRSGARGSFVSSVTSALETFYADVVENLRPWTPPAPQLPDAGSASVEPAVAELLTTT